MRRRTRRTLDRVLDVIAVAVWLPLFVLVADADAADMCGPAAHGYDPRTGWPCPSHGSSLPVTGTLAWGDVLFVFLFALCVSALLVHVGRWIRAR